LGDDIIAARESVIQLAGMGDKRSTVVLIKVLNTHPDTSVKDVARLLLLRSNNMMPSKPFPDYTYTLEKPAFTVEGEILFLKHGNIPEWIIEMYTNAVKEKLRIDVRVEECPFDFKEQEHPSRSQYEMVGMLEKVFHHISGKTGKVVVVTDRDTFVKGRRWDTGCSAIYGPGSVVSIKRLNPEYWGRKKDPDLYKERLLKVLFHELAHTLIPSDKHCKRWSCLLHSTESLGDIDKLPKNLCPICTALQEETLRIIRAKDEKSKGVKGPDHDNL